MAQYLGVMRTLLVALIASPLGFSFAAAASLSQATSPAAAQTRSIEIQPRLRVGERLQLNLVKSREDWQGAARLKSNESTTPVEVECVEQLADGWRCRWTYGRVELPTVDGAEPDEITRRIAGLVEGLQLDLRLDVHGAFAGVADEAKTVEQLDRRFDSLAALLLEKAGVAPADRSRAEAVIEQLRPLLRGPALLASSLREPQFFYVLGAGDFEFGVAQEFETHLASPISSAVLPARRTIELVELRRDGAEALVSWKQRIDAQALAAELLERAKAQAREAGEREPTQDELLTMDVRDDALLYIDLASGLPTRVEFARTIVTGDRRRIDAFRLEPRAAAK